MPTSYQYRITSKPWCIEKKISASCARFTDTESTFFPPNFYFQTLLLCYACIHTVTIWTLPERQLYSLLVLEVKLSWILRQRSVLSISAANLLVMPLFIHRKQTILNSVSTARNISLNYSVCKLNYFRKNRKNVYFFFWK